MKIYRCRKCGYTTLNEMTICKNCFSTEIEIVKIDNFNRLVKQI